jgi:hypothetical protein
MALLRLLLQTLGYCEHVPMNPRKTVVAVCFLPDTGHVISLLRLARLVKTHLEARVVAIVPAPFERAALDQGLEFLAIGGIDQGAGGELFAKLARRSIFRSAFSYPHDLQDHYWSGLREAASRELPRVVAALQDLKPALLLADFHVFGDLYRRLAAHSGAVLVMHRSWGGALRYTPRPFVRAYGLSNAPAWKQRLVEIAGVLYAEIDSQWYHLHVKRRRTTQARIALSRAKVRDVFGKCEPGAEQLIISSGVSAIEHRVAAPASAPLNDREILLAPLVDVEVAALPADLEAWLAAQPRGRVVYVCFGTMVRPRGELLRTILRGLRATDASVLWAQPSAQREWAQNEPSAPNVRFEDFAPQARLLVGGRVDVFVTHAGLGAVQESLLGGVPLFCVPFLWDQPYLASVVERLGAGIRYFPRTLTQAQVTAGVRELLDNPAWRTHAQAIAGELRALQRAPAQTAWMDAL